ncbi:hypothetical protein RSAG8_13949, partial [Rhizoctonia solani AG-8 WAC10335]
MRPTSISIQDIKVVIAKG